MRRARDPDAAATYFSYRLAGAHLSADANERRRGVAVVDVSAGQRTAGDLQDRRVGPEAVGALLHDRAGCDGDECDLRAARVADRADVDALILRPLGWRQDQVLGLD